MHQLGFWHEHERDDRQEHIEINWFKSTQLQPETINIRFESLLSLKLIIFGQYLGQNSQNSP